MDAEWLHFVRDSVYAFSHALHNLWKAKCRGRPGLCQAMAHDGHIHGQELYEYLRNVSVKGNFCCRSLSFISVHEMLSSSVIIVVVVG